MSNTPSQVVPRSWHSLYRTAIYEFDLNAIPRKIDAAREAIRARLKELTCGDHGAERIQLMSSLQVLDDLLEMYHAGHVNAAKD